MDPSPSDVQLGATAARTVSVPRRQPADSFVLHAPLELVARFGLLPWAPEADRPAARRRLATVATLFAAAGPAVDPAGESSGERPAGADRFDTAAAAAAHLTAAIDAGDLDGTDAAAVALGRLARADELPGLLAAAVLPRLAAAGHAPIFLHLLPRVAPRGELPVALLRPLARELARHPDWRLSWFEADPADAEGDDGPPDLGEAIVGLPHLGIDGSTFIRPTMAQVERTGVAPRHLGRAVRTGPFAAGARAVTRLAARSMLVEPDEHAPYGWSHALTMPLAVLGLAGRGADPRTALAVAATFLAGFRTSLGTVDLGAPYAPERPAGDLAWALEHEPAAAAAAVWHADPADHAALAATLAGQASRRHDAHLVKYTLAALDAAASDPEAAALHLAAAARLLAYWVEHPDPLD